MSGATVHFTGAGTCVIDANQAGNGSFATAAQVSQSVTTVSGFFVTTSTLSGATRGVPYNATAPRLLRRFLGQVEEADQALPRA